jgi:hypothetical protein
MLGFLRHLHWGGRSQQVLGFTGHCTGDGGLVSRYLASSGTQTRGGGAGLFADAWLHPALTQGREESAGTWPHPALTQGECS